MSQTATRHKEAIVLKEVASASLPAGEARRAYKICKGLKLKDDCQQIVDYYVGNIGDMADFLSAEGASPDADGDEPAVDSQTIVAGDVLEVTPFAQES